MTEELPAVSARAPREKDVFRRSEEIFTLLVESVKDYAIFMLDPQGNIMTWNAGAQRANGYMADEIIGKHFSIFYTDDAIQSAHPQYELKIATEQGRYEEEGWRIKKDGTLFWANVLITAVRDYTGELVGFAKVTRDLTERRNVAEELRRTEQILARMVESVKDYAIFMLDVQGNVMTWNEGARRIKGYKAEEIIGKHFSTFYNEDAKRINHPQHELNLALRDGRYEEEGWRIRKDGTQFWANVVITAVRDTENRLLGFAKVTRDLTERRQAQLDLERARDEALVASQLKSQFVANVSHEIRTPLSGVVGLTEILSRNSSLDEDAKESVSRIYSSSKRLLSILNDLLDFAKLEAGKVEVDKSAFSLRAVIDDVIGLSQPKVDEKGLVITIEYLGTVPDVIVGDQSKLRQVLLNLVHNAVKFTERGGVQVSVEVADPDLRFLVTDTGVGIDSVNQSKLFQPFVQADGSVRREFGGTGLGLSIAQQYVHLMGGQIGLESAPGRGSTFWFTIPKIEATEELGETDGKD